MINYQGVPVIINQFLPFEKTYAASDVESKQEVKISSGELIHSFLLEGILHISKESYEQLKQQITIKQ